MKTKKTVIAVLTAALLIFALLVSSCMELAIEKLDNDKGDNYQVTPGKGLVRFRISNGAARTVFPDTDVANMYFQFTFKDHANVKPDYLWPTGTGTLQPTHNGSGDDTIAFLIPDGVYDVIVTAYNKSAAVTDNLISGSTLDNNGGSGYEVDSTSLTPCYISVTLAGKITSGKKGVFKYNIPAPALPTSDFTDPVKITSGAVTLDVLDFTGGTVGSTAISGPITITGSLAPSSGIAINSGLYMIRVVFKASFCQDRVLTEVMHVFDGLTSTFEPSSTPAFAQNRFTVRFSTNSSEGNITDSAFNTNFGEQEVDNADVITEPSTDPVDAAGDYDFAGWYDDSNIATATLWDFNNNLVYSDNITLYASWTPVSPVSKGDVEVEVVFTPPLGSNHNLVAVVNDGSTNVSSITFEDLYDSAFIKITLTSFTGTPTWTLGDGTDLSSLVVDGVLTIDKTTPSSYLRKLVQDTNTITVSGLAANGTGFSQTVNITITPKP